MVREIRRVVTGFDEVGKSVIAADEAVAPIVISAMPNSDFYTLWGTDGPGATVGVNGEGSTVKPFYPPRGGSRFVLLRYGPASEVPEYAGDPAELEAEVAEKIPGAFAPMEVDHPGMHTTDTVDYIFCVDGEIYMEVDDGREVLLKPGDCVIQRGTRHAWHNRSDRPCLMLYVLIGAERR